MAGEGFTPVRLSDDGRGIAQAEGKVVFVRGALPGETVEAERVAVHRRFDEAELLTVREAAPERVTPRGVVHAAREKVTRQREGETSGEDAME